MGTSANASVQTKQQSGRLIGFDVARAFAFVGMVIVNFKVVMVSNSAEFTPLYRLAAMFEGRAVATFIVLAGVGITLMSRRAVASSDKAKIVSLRRVIWKRSLFLFVIGLPFALLWPADILHFYAFYLAFSALLIGASNRTLWLSAAVITLASPLLILIFNYEAGWEWASLEYTDFWTPIGMIRHLFFNGFHPFFPWAAFIPIGMWLGRQEMRDAAVRRRLLRWSLLVVCIVEPISFVLTRVLSGDFVYMFDTAPLPPTPWYIIAGSATALAVIALTFELTERLADGWFTRALTSTGQMALTLYVAHVVVGMGALDEFGRLQNQPMAFIWVSAIIFSTASILFAHFWRKRFRRGPLETIMRRMT